MWDLVDYGSVSNMDPATNALNAHLEGEVWWDALAGLDWHDLLGGEAQSLLFTATEAPENPALNM